MTIEIERQTNSHERKVWHPVMWQQPTGPTNHHIDIMDKPHLRIIRNVRKFLKETQDPVLKQKHIEDMLLTLPSASKHF